MFNKLTSAFPIMCNRTHIWMDWAVFRGQQSNLASIFQELMHNLQWCFIFDFMLMAFGSSSCSRPSWSKENQASSHIWYPIHFCYYLQLQRLKILDMLQCWFKGCLSKRKGLGQCIQNWHGRIPRDTRIFHKGLLNWLLKHRFYLC